MIVLLLVRDIILFVSCCFGFVSLSSTQLLVFDLWRQGESSPQSAWRYQTFYSVNWSMRGAQSGLQHLLRASEAHPEEMEMQTVIYTK